MDIPDRAQEAGGGAGAGLPDVELRAALAQLPDAQRTVIEMAYFEGYTRQEIAVKLDEPLGTVHTRARLGLLKLKDLLSGLRARSSEH
jgi:RNA polymerase sigma-70 factor (ECF subfamily)